jgi:hypothetical protein
MRHFNLLALPIATLLAGCNDTPMPNGQLYFTPGQETSALGDIDHFTVERLDSKNNSVLLYTGATLPTTVDMGLSGNYRFRATGFDANEVVLARGESLAQDVGALSGGEIPIFVARTTRTSQAEDHFTVAPGAHPKVALLSPANLWMWTNNVSTDYISTDGYNYAYWQHVTPKGTVDFSTINCPVTPCAWSNLVMVGGYFAIAIADEWAILVDEYNEESWDYEDIPELGSFGNIAGGRVMAGASGTAFLVGAARTGSPTAYTVLFDNLAYPYVKLLSTPRAGAATVFEASVGLVVAGGSSAGSGVERILPGGTAFVAVNYPADPVTGAALVVLDETHVLRVGGKNADATPADTVSIDVACGADTCAAEPLVGQSVPIVAAQSFFDSESGDSLIVGEDDSGLTIIYRYTKATGTFSPIEIPDNQQRVHATPIELPARQVALIGGTNPTDPTSSRSTISVVSF